MDLDLSFNNNNENDYAVMNFWAGTWGMNNKWVAKRYIMEIDCDGYNPEAITITCPDDINASTTTATATLSWDAATATTTCLLNNDIINSNQIAGMPSGAEFPIGTHMISYEAIDNCENVEMCSFFINVMGESCPTEINGFTKLGEHEGHGYYISDEKSRWEDAKLIAENIGANLVSVNTQAENDFLQSTLGNEMVYIGYSDAATEGVGTWANGDAVTLDLSYDNSEEKDYAVMNFWAGTWELNNHWVQKRFVVELDCIANRIQEEETINTANDFILKVNPNPAKDYIRLKMESTEEQNILIELFSINGRLVYSAKKDLQLGSTEMTIPVKTLTSGFFLLQITGTDFKETRKLVKE